MATLRKRGARWQVQVRRNGFPQYSKSFLTKSAAEAWARQREVELDKGEVVLQDQRLRTSTVADLLSRYLKDVTPTKLSASSEATRLRAILRHPFSKLLIKDLTARSVASYRDERLKTVSAPSARRELAILQHCFELAKREWGFPLPINPVANVAKPMNATPRIRRVSEAELLNLSAALTRCRNPVVKSAFLFALATGMRRGEVLSLTWVNVDFENRVAFLPMTKNGEPRRVPLSTEAIETLQSVRESVRESVLREKGQIFPISANALRLAWERAKRRVGVENLRFHDLRHEAISRFFELGLSVPEVSLISGHKDARMLFRYTHLKPENVAKKIEALTQR